MVTDACSHPAFQVAFGPRYHASQLVGRPLDHPPGSSCAGKGPLQLPDKSRLLSYSRGLLSSQRPRRHVICHFGSVVRGWWLTPFACILGGYHAIAINRDARGPNRTISHSQRATSYYAIGGINEHIINGDKHEPLSLCIIRWHPGIIVNKLCYLRCIRRCRSRCLMISPSTSQSVCASLQQLSRQYGCTTNSGVYTDH